MQALSVAFVVSLVTAVVSGIFALIVFKRWSERHRPHLMAWGIGLALFCLAASTQAILAQAWNETLFMLWYWTGAIALVPWLGQGTVYLLVRRGSIAQNVQMALILVCIMT